MDLLRGLGQRHIFLEHGGKGILSASNGWDCSRFRRGCAADFTSNSRIQEKESPLWKGLFLWTFVGQYISLFRKNMPIVTSFFCFLGVRSYVRELVLNLVMIHNQVMSSYILVWKHSFAVKLCRVGILRFEVDTFRLLAVLKPVCLLVDPCQKYWTSVATLGGRVSWKCYLKVFRNWWCLLFLPWFAVP